MIDTQTSPKLVGASIQNPRSTTLGACWVLLASLFLTGLSPAQLRFDELGLKALPANNGQTSAIVLGDLDGDGDLDGVAGSPLGQNQFYLNDGSGALIDGTALRLPVDTDETNALALGDVDGDGDLDIVLGNFNGQNRLYLNAGTGTFSDVTTVSLPTMSDYTLAVGLADVDSDGDLDVVFANDSQDRLLLNDGAGVFTDVTATHFPTLPSGLALHLALEFGDLDSDGDVDLFLGGFANRVYLNDGSGVFSDASATNLPSTTLTIATEALSLGDVDGDGDLDVYLGTNSGPNRLYLNDGSAVFSDVTLSNLPAGNIGTYATLLSDLDADGDLDVILGSQYSQDRMLLNDGTGVFTDGTVPRFPVDSASVTFAVAAGDLDGDGDLDLVWGQRLRNRLYWNVGGGNFVDASAPRLPPGLKWDSGAVASADVNGDGHPDLLLAQFVQWPGSITGEQNTLLLNDGSGRFSDVTPLSMPPAFDTSFDLAVGDVDSDGDIDVFFGNRGTQNRLYLNDGAGVFSDVTAARLPSDSAVTSAVAFLDVDVDGDLDVVMGNIGADRLYLNDGFGNFADVSASRLPPRIGATEGCVAGDVNADGLVDLVFANSSSAGGSGQNTLYLNDGSGGFADATTTNLPADADHSAAVLLTDVDLDGDPDLFFVNFSAQNRLYLNDGTGVFADATAWLLPAAIDTAVSAASGDIDGDGDPDLVLGNSSALGNTILLNDGHGAFFDAGAGFMPDHAASRGIALCDIDGDQDLDFIFSHHLSENRLYVNLSRQLDAPNVLGIGKTYRLDFYARHGLGTLLDVALPYVSITPSSIPWAPLGTIGLDPTQMVALNPVIIPQPAGVQSLTFSVPNLTVLAGIPFYAQALMVPYPLPARLTGTMSNVVLP